MTHRQRGIAVGVPALCHRSPPCPPLPSPALRAYSPVSPHLSYYAPHYCPTTYITVHSAGARCLPVHPALTAFPSVSVRHAPAGGWYQQALRDVAILDLAADLPAVQCPVGHRLQGHRLLFMLHDRAAHAYIPPRPAGPMANALSQGLGQLMPGKAAGSDDPMDTTDGAGSWTLAPIAICICALLLGRCFIGAYVDESLEH